MYQELIAEAQQLAREAEALVWCPGAAELRVRLEQALTRGADEQGARPLTIVLLGGTGVGKSSMFNLLCGGTASPVSEGKRAFTERLHIAVDERARSYFARLGDEVCTFHPGIADGVALIDTPDVDSVVGAHGALTRQALGLADLVVYVTTPDKRAVFDVTNEVRVAAARARWFFVLNKADMVRNDLAAVRADFDRRLRELGFEPDDKVRFVVSTVEEAAYDNERLRRALTGARTPHEVRMARETIVFQQLLYAVRDDVVGAMHDMSERLRQRHEDYAERVRAVYEQAVKRLAAGRIVHTGLEETMWRELSMYKWWLMSVPLWLRRRIGYVRFAYMVARMMTGGITLTRLARTAWYTLRAIVMGYVPLRGIAEQFQPEELRALEQIERDVQHQLNEYGCVVSTVEQAEAVRDDEEEKKRPARLEERIAVAVFGVAQDEPRAAGTRSIERIEQALAQAIQAHAEKAAQHVSRAWRIAVANLLPGWQAGEIAWRAVHAWRLEEYLPWEFYTMALLMMVISYVPGYMLVSYSIHRALKRGVNPQGIAQLLIEPYETRALRVIQERVAVMVTRARSLRVHAERMLCALDKQLSTARFGAAAPRSVCYGIDGDGVGVKGML